MQSRVDKANMQDSGSYNVPPSTIVAQPWWQCAGFGTVHTSVLTESALKEAQISVANKYGGNKEGQALPGDNINSGGGVHDTRENTQGESGMEGNYGQEQQHVPPVTYVTPPAIPEYFVSHTQLELGHSIACVPYPYSDPYYGCIPAAFGTQPLVHPEFVGLPHNRIALPLELAEEPVYVNAKQYHGILRRRQSRAKEELEKKLTKARKPYIHESRHLHAMRRVRGCGGRFMNTKKADADAVNSLTENSGDTNAAHIIQSISSDSENLLPPFSGREQFVCHSHTNCNFQQHSASQSPTYGSSSVESAEGGACSGRQHNGIRVNGPSNRPLAI